MNLIEEKVIPSFYGRIFATNASTDRGLYKIKSAIEEVDGVQDVVVIKEVYLREFIVHANKIVTVSSIEKAVRKAGYSCIPKGIFPT